MANWKVVQNTPEKHENNEPQVNSNSKWRIVDQEKAKENQPKESLTQSLLMAPNRIVSDVGIGAANAINAIPGYYEAAKTEVPGAYNALTGRTPDISQKESNERLLHALSQGAGGFFTGTNKLLHLPAKAANYAENRLNLLPHDVSNVIQNLIPPEEWTQEQINNVFGEPKYPGEKLIHGAGELAVPAVPIKELTQGAARLRPTAKNVASNVVRKREKLINEYNHKYEGIWKEAEHTGYNKVPADVKKLDSDMHMIKEYYAPESYEMVTKFIENPTLQNAQQAHTQLWKIHNELRHQSEKGGLDPYKVKIKDSAVKADDYIKSHMFKNSKGKTNKPLKKEYEEITQGYKEDVVPYRYNDMITNYMNKKKTAQQLVSSLNQNAFGAQKANKHLSLKIRNALVNHPYSSLTAGAILGQLYRSGLGETPERNPNAYVNRE